MLCQKNPFTSLASPVAEMRKMLGSAGSGTSPTWWPWSPATGRRGRRRWQTLTWWRPGGGGSTSPPTRPGPRPVRCIWFHNCVSVWVLSNDSTVNVIQASPVRVCPLDLSSCWYFRSGLILNWKRLLTNQIVQSESNKSKLAGIKLFYFAFFLAGS